MKWGILATGNIANKFAKTILAMEAKGENQKLVACASRDINKAKNFAAEYGIPQAYGSYEAILNDNEVEAIYIATPNSMHYDNCKMCLEAGKHVLCEKPFTLRKSEARELYGYAKEKGLFIMEGFWIRFLPALIKLQELIKSGEIGDVVYARSDYGFIAKGARKARKFDASLGGGALLDIGIYNLGFMRMVMGDDKIEGYSCDYHLNEYGTDDFSVINLQYAGGRKATITTSIGMDIKRNAAIYGTKGSIYLDDFQKAERLLVCAQDKEEYSLEFPILMGGFEYEVRHMSECIEKGKCESDVLKGEATMDIIEFMENILLEWKVFK